MTHIALVESDPSLAASLVVRLSEAGHSHAVFASAAAFTEAFRNGSHEMVVIDWSLEDASGLQLLRFVREQADWYVPVILLTERGREDDGVSALAAGADDFVPKPVGSALFTARIGALARRALEDRRTLQVGPFRLDRARRIISRNGRPITLTDKEFQLAALLLANPGQTMTRDFLLATVWGEETDAATRTVDTHASRVRHKLGLTRRGELWLRPVYGQGYELVRKDREVNGTCATDPELRGGSIQGREKDKPVAMGLRWA